MKKSTISIIILSIVLSFAVISGLWKYLLKDHIDHLKDDLMSQNDDHHYSSTPETQILEWVLDNQRDSLEIAAKKLKNTHPELSKKLKKHLKNTQKEKNNLFVKNEDKNIDKVLYSDKYENEEVDESNDINDDKKEILISKAEKESNPSNNINTKYLKIKIGNNSVYYTGEIIDGKAHGLGKGVYDNGMVYEGSWNNNKKEGNGILKWPDGSVYEGHFMNNMRSGKGTHVWRNQEKYIGEWLNDNRHGEGTLFDKKGKIKYKGEWKSDVFIP